jgi:hypothetical protein
VAEDHREGVVTSAEQIRPEDLDDFPRGRKQQREWPKLEPAALYGLAGEVVREMDPYTEADPVAILATFLAAAGCYIGPVPHCWIGDVEHPARLWPLLIGATASGRKGTADAVVRRVLDAADIEFLLRNVESGLTSGSGLIERVRDASGDDKDAKDYVPEVADKRLLVIEHEFAGVLRRGGRDGNDLVERLREAWDGRPLSSMARSKNRLRATHTHITVIGHVTQEELRLRLAETSDVVGGTMNRFLPLLVRRSKRLPGGGGVPEDAVRAIGKLLAERRDLMRGVRRMVRDLDCDRWWCDEVYDELTPDVVAEGVIARLVSRAAPYTMRLALTYALLDGDRTIRRPHLAAALAVWRYVLASCEYVFGDAVGDPDLIRLATAVREAGDVGMTREDVSALFNRHKSAAVLDELITQLLRLDGFIATEEPRADGKPGRPTLRIRYLRS